MHEPTGDQLMPAARNLLVNCAEMKSGDRLLILQENPDLAYYDASAVRDIATAATSLGLRTTLCEVPFSEAVQPLNPEIAELMAGSDCTLFFARMGDQIRFREMPPGTKSIVSYALDRQMLASGFGTAHFKGFEALKTAVDAAFAGADEIHVTCPLGTDFKGPGARSMLDDGADVTIIRFPMSVFTPIPSKGFAGKVAQAHFLTGTGSQYYHPYAAPLRDVLFIHFENQRITRFEGSAQDIAAADAHYQFVARKFDIDRDNIHSWHVGIHPGCAYLQPAGDSYERWSGGAFGNPRLLHFHTCGNYPPGEISWNIVDPTVRIDGVEVWQNGRLFPDRIAGGAKILARYPCVAALFDHPAQDIGV
jgi:hypothetical protein